MTDDPRSDAQPDPDEAGQQMPDLPGWSPDPAAGWQGPPRRRKGPGLLEALVGLSILVSLSGVVMPLIGADVEAERMISAQSDMQAIARGLMDYKRDTLFLPTGVRGKTDLGWLYGPGAIPRDNHFAEIGSARELSDALLNPSLGGPGWLGPYADEAQLGPDPWGQAYVVHVDGWITGRKNPFVLSAGPNGVLETRPVDRRPAGDDLLFMLN
jgi:type II secretory pathway pseudopilin PulG